MTVGVAIPSTSGAAESSELRLAIAAMPSVESIGDLVTAAMDGRPEIQILERISLDQILSERRLDYNRIETRLAGADAVLLLEEIPFESQKLLVARLTACRKGLAVWSEAYPLSRDPGAIAGDIALALPMALKRLTAAGDLQVVSVSLNRFVPRFNPSKPAEDQAVEAAGFVRLLAGALSSRPGLALTERLSLDLPGLENKLTGIDRSGYASADYLVEGDFTLGEPESTANVSIAPAGTSVVLKREVRSPTTELGSLVAAIAADIDRGIRDLAAQQSGKPVPGVVEKDESLAPDTEADAAFDEVQRLYQLKQYDEAGRRAASARELGFANHPGLTALALKSQLGAVFLDISGGALPSRLTGPGYNTGVAAAVHPLEPYPDADRPVSEEQWAKLIDAAWSLNDVVTHVLPTQKPGPSTTTGLQVTDGKSSRPVVTVSSRDSWLQNEVFAASRTLAEYYERNLWESVESNGPESIFSERRRELHSVLLLINKSFQALSSADSPRFYNPFTEIVYQSGPGDAVAHLERLLAPGGFGGPASSETSAGEFSALESRFFGIRNSLSHQYPTGSPYPGAGSLPGGANTIWKFRAGGGVRLGDLVSQALSPRGDDRDLIRQTDAQLLSIFESPDSDTASQRTQAAREWLVAQSDELARRQVLGAYGLWLVRAETTITCPGSLADPNGETAPWWRSFHSMVTGKQARIGSQFSQSLLLSAVSQRTEAVWAGFAEGVIDDLERYNAKAPEAFKLKPFTLTLLKQRYLKTPAKGNPASPQPVPSPAPPAPPASAEDYNITGYAYTYPGRKLVQSAHHDGVFHFLVASEVPEEAEVVIFDSVTAQFTDFIKIPPPINTHFAERGRNDRSSILGALHISEERILVVAPGSIGQYDRRSKQWTTRELPFLKDKKGFRCLGDRLFCFDGSIVRRGGGPLSESVPHPRSGFYAVDLQTLEISTYFDTARRPASVQEDEASVANFFGNPLPLGDSEVMAAFEAAPFSGGAFRFSDGEKFSRVGPPLSGISANVGMNWHEGKVFVTSVSRRAMSINQIAPSPLVVSSFLVRAEVDRGIWQMVNTDLGIPGRFQFPPAFRQSENVDASLKPLVWTNDREMLFLSSQKAGDSRRYLYYWPDGKKEAPIRIALRLGGLIENPKDTHTDEMKRRLEWEALESVEQLFLDDKNLVFITGKGAWFQSRKSWDDQMRRLMGTP